MSHEHERVVPGLINERDLCKIREAVCIQTEKIFDSCKEKDCIEDAPVLFDDDCHIKRIINEAINVKCRRAQVMDVFADLEEVPFKRGFFTVDVKFFITVTLDFFVPGDVHGGIPGPGGTTIFERTGVVVFDKKVILFGSEGNVKIFKSHFVQHGIDKQIHSNLQQDNQPISKIEVAEPICLSARIEDIRDKLFENNCCCMDRVPEHIVECVRSINSHHHHDHDHDHDHENELPRRRVVATIGLFSIIKLVRFVQLVVPAFDYCVPNKECIAATEENPCELFDTIEFPVNEFFPPQIFDFPGAVEAEQEMHEGMHGHHHHND